MFRTRFYPCLFVALTALAACSLQAAAQEPITGEHKAALQARRSMVAWDDLAKVDAKSEARAEIQKLKASINQATKEITDRENAILGGEILIVVNEAAIVDAKKKPNNDGAVLALEISLALLKASKNQFIKEKTEWQQYKRDCEKLLAEWEKHLKDLGD